MSVITKVLSKTFTLQEIHEDVKMRGSVSVSFIDTGYRRADETACRMSMLSAALPRMATQKGCFASTIPEYVLRDICDFAFPMRSFELRTALIRIPLALPKCNVSDTELYATQFPTYPGLHRALVARLEIQGIPISTALRTSKSDNIGECFRMCMKTSRANISSIKYVSSVMACLAFAAIDVTKQMMLPLVWTFLSSIVYQCNPSDGWLFHDSPSRLTDCGHMLKDYSRWFSEEWSNVLGSENMIRSLCMCETMETLTDACIEAWKAEHVCLDKIDDALKERINVETGVGKLTAEILRSTESLKWIEERNCPYPDVSEHARNRCSILRKSLDAAIEHSRRCDRKISVDAPSHFIRSLGISHEAYVELGNDAIRRAKEREQAELEKKRAKHEQIQKREDSKRKQCKSPVRKRKSEGAQSQSAKRHKKNNK